MRLFHSLQWSLPVQILSAPVNADTAVLHGIISESDEVNVQFSTRTVP